MVHSACQVRNSPPLPACICPSPSSCSITAALDELRCFSVSTMTSGIWGSNSPIPWMPLPSHKPLGYAACALPILINSVLSLLKRWPVMNPSSSMSERNRNWKRYRQCMPGRRHSSGRVSTRVLKPWGIELQTRVNEDVIGSVACGRFKGSTRHVLPLREHRLPGLLQVRDALLLPATTRHLEGKWHRDTMRRSTTCRGMCFCFVYRLPSPKEVHTYDGLRTDPHQARCSPVY